MQTMGGTELDRAFALIDEIGDAAMQSSVPWIVQEVTPLSGYEFHVRFVDGVQGVVRMRGQIFRSDAGVFSSLRDPAVFATVQVQEGDVVWPVGLDLAPDAMYEEIKANGEWVLR